MKTTYKHFLFECTNCSNEVNKLFDVSKTEEILGFIYCEKCGTDSLKCMDRMFEESTTGPAIIGERWTQKLDGDFKYIMKNMKKRHPNSNIPDY